MTLDTFFEKFELFADAPDAVAKMRELVLQLAVQGRLADVDESDEPVAKFLERIWSNKADARSEITDAEKAQPFDLPPHWRWVVLAEVVEFSIGKTPPRGNSSFWSPEDHSWVSIADMKHYQTVTETKEKVSSLAAKDVFRQRFAEPGSILMSFKLTIGKVARVGIKCFHNEAIISLKPPEQELSDFLFRFLPIFAALQTSNNAIKGNTLNKGLLTLLPIALPPLAEQKRIVAKVDELMGLCDRLEMQQKERETRRAALARATLARFADAPTPANLNMLFYPPPTSYSILQPSPSSQSSIINCQLSISPADLRKSILTLAVQGKLVPQDPNDEPVSDLLIREAASKSLLVKEGKVRDEKPLEPMMPEEEPSGIPAGWAWCKIDKLVFSLRNDIRTGPFGSSLHKHDHKDAGVPVWGIESIGKDGCFTGRNNIFVDEDKALELAPFSVKGGDIIVSRSGTVGELCRLPDAIQPGLISTNLMKISLNHRVMTSDYFCLQFRGAISINAQLSELCFGSTRLFLTQKILTKLLFPVPPLAEQRRIVAKVDALMALVDALETQIATARTTATALLEAAVAELTTRE